MSAVLVFCLGAVFGGLAAAFAHGCALIVRDNPRRPQ